MKLYELEHFLHCSCTFGIAERITTERYYQSRSSYDLLLNDFMVRMVANDLRTIVYGLNLSYFLKLCTNLWDIG